MHELMGINKEARGKREIAGVSTFILNLHYNIPPAPKLIFSSILSRLLLRTALSPLGMLALPLYPASIGPHQSPETVPQYRPAKDIESFNKLLPPVVEFVEGSSSGTFLIAEGRYEPVNGSPKAAAAPEVLFRHLSWSSVSKPA
jgi:hypothetical protein